MLKFISVVFCFIVSFDVLADEPITPLVPIEGLSPDKVKLGQQLFNDNRLSKDNSISCASCHLLSKHGADNRTRSIGINGSQGIIKTPTVYNSAFNFVQFWDGRSRTLNQQVSGPIHNPIEMGSHWLEVIDKLSADPAVAVQFKTLYDDGLTAANIADAITTFERSLITLNSRFDRWLEGDEKALSANEKQGYQLFKAFGCISCHQGRNVGGNMYAYMGTMGDYFSDRGQPITVADYGRFNVTGMEDDKFLFKVPSLRLVALQRYFFHDASERRLVSAIEVMAKYQLGRNINEQDAELIAAFLRSLVGQHPLLEPQ
jgi:cytochrome c peroxidase